MEDPDREEFCRIFGDRCHAELIIGVDGVGLFVEIELDCPGGKAAARIDFADNPKVFARMVRNHLVDKLKGYG